MAFAWCGDAYLADDLVQQTLCKALQRKAQLRDPRSLDRWLFRIMANCRNDFHRRYRETVEFDDDASPVTVESAESSAERASIVARVRRAIGCLSEPQRQVLTMVDLEGYAYADVAEVLEIPIGTVMSRLCRARRSLKEALDNTASTSPRRGELRRIK